MRDGDSPAIITRRALQTWIEDTKVNTRRRWEVNEVAKLQQDWARRRRQLRIDDRF